MSRRKRSLSRIQARVRSWLRLSPAAPARCRPRSLIGRTSALCSNSVRSCSSGLLEVVRPVRRAEAAPGDEVGAGRDRRGRVDLQQGQLLARPSSRSVGRGASSSCARTAMRRACALVSRCTDGRLRRLPGEPVPVRGPLSPEPLVARVRLHLVGRLLRRARPVARRQLRYGYSTGAPPPSARRPSGSRTARRLRRRRCAPFHLGCGRNPTAGAAAPHPRRAVGTLRTARGRLPGPTRHGRGRSARPVPGREGRYRTARTTPTPRSRRRISPLSAASRCCPTSTTRRPHIHDKPAVAGRREAGTGVVELRLGHAATLTARRVRRPHKLTR